VLFLIDAQLPPSLVAALHDAGCDAVHVGDLGLLTATDRQIWDEAVSRSAVLVTKDRDFPIFRAASNDGPTILWASRRQHGQSNPDRADFARFAGNY
jgi:predicted nuclease of predicted toxin-antitoxin system